ncbi:MAG: ferrous iron transport protein A [Firmicutes bacterium]|nr:ferrous iron transport protein A [Bacillota bacterium]
MRPIPRLTLADLARGEEAEILAVEAADPAYARKLLVLGLVPGVTVRVLHRWPAYVVQAGRTTLALDGQLARLVFVRALMR